MVQQHAVSSPAAPIPLVVLFAKEVTRLRLAPALTTTPFVPYYCTTFEEAADCVVDEPVDALFLEGDAPADFIRHCRRVRPHIEIVRLLEKSRFSRRRGSVARELQLPLKAGALDDIAGEILLRKRAREQNPASLPDVLLRQMENIHSICEELLQGEDLGPALLSIAERLSEMYVGGTVGLMAVDTLNQGHMVLHSRSPLRRDSFHVLRQTLYAHRDRLSGTVLPPEQVRESIQCDLCEEGDPELPEWVIAPMIAQNHFQGLVAFAQTRRLCPGRIQTLALHQTAAHLSTLLLAQRKMRALTILDPLTSCYNRRHLDNELPHCCRRAALAGTSMGVLLLDVDYFKDINDTLGHASGDKTLIEFHQVLQQEVGPANPIFRLGGDEFLVLFPEIGVEDAVVLTTRLHETLRNHSIRHGDRVIRITGSSGLYVAVPAATINAHHAFLDRADKALYTSKRNGRDRFTLWEKENKPRSVPEAAPGQIPEADIPRKKASLLLVDDEAMLLETLSRSLAGMGYEVITASNVTEAETILHEHKDELDVLISDISMPGRDGFELLALAKQISPLTVRILITGNVTTDVAITAMRSGTYDFLQKPFSRQQLLALVHRAVEYRRLLVENREYQNYLEEMVRKKNEELDGRLNELRDAYDFSLDAMVAMLDAWERETSRHSQRVMELTCLLAGHLDVPEPTLSQFLRGALLHDIGKIGVPHHVLSKPSALTPEEWKLMREHPSIGHRFLCNCSFLGEALDIILCHHESYDGAGYPRGLRGEAIPLGARIFSVIDAYDTMRSPRVYKKSIPQNAACEEIRRQSGKQFDPMVVDAFFEVLPEIELLGKWDLLKQPEAVVTEVEEPPPPSPKLKLKETPPKPPREAPSLPADLPLHPDENLPPPVKLSLKKEAFHESRDSKRVPIVFQGELTICGVKTKNKTQPKITIRGPSMLGVGLLANFPIPDKAEVLILAENKSMGARRDCRLRGKVVWTRSKIGTLVYEAGVELMPRKCPDYKVWQEFVLEKLRMLE
jgi:diguanylate cyclase (GGDEF)-like protein